MTIAGLIGDGGNAAALPDHTVEALLSCASLGCDGVLFTIRTSADGDLFLLRSPDLADSTDGRGRIDCSRTSDVEQLDAGAQFLAEVGAPWKRNDKKGYLLTVPRFIDAPWWLPRRWRIYMELPEDVSLTSETTSRAMDVLQSSASHLDPHIVVTSIPAVVAVRRAIPDVSLCLRIDRTFVGWDALSGAGVKTLVVQSPAAQSPDDGTFLKSVAAQASHLGLSLIYQCEASDLTDALRDFLQKLDAPVILAMRDPDAGLGLLWPSISLQADSLAAKTPDLNRWRWGFAREDNDETELSQDNGFCIAIAEGSHYSGGSAVTRQPLHGPFSVTVDFAESHPATATTMELAVVNMTGNRHYWHVGDVERHDDVYDPHGSPPFACVENDEADGFRVMNNQGSSTFTNRYGRDVGPAGSQSGSLRLDRAGPWITGYFRSTETSRWIGCGSVVNESLNDLLFVRLGAKHWPKIQPPLPANRVTFRNFNVTFRPPHCEIEMPLYETELGTRNDS